MNRNDLMTFVRDRWELLLPFFASLLAFVLRYHFLATYQYPMMIHEQDAVGYMGVAQNIVQFRPLDLGGRPPGYPIIIALFSLLPIGLEYAARLASIFMDALIVIPLFGLARIYLSRFSAFAVCLLWAFFSFSLCFSTSPLSQSSYLFYLLLGIVLLHQGLTSKGRGWAFGSGVFFALSFLTRPEGIVGFGCGFLLCLMSLCSRDGFNRRTALLPIAFLLGFFLLAGPYFISFHNQMGYWGITAKTEAALKTQDGTMVLNSSGELNKTKAGVSVWEEYYGTLPAFVSAVRANVKAYFLVYYKTFPAWMHIVSLIGMAYLLWVKRIGVFLYLLILLAVTVPNYIVNVSKTHSYLYSVFPAMFICFIACIENITKGIERVIIKFIHSNKPALYEAGLAIILFVIVSCISIGFFQEADANYQSPGLVNEVMITEKIYKEAGELIKYNSQKNDVIMTRWGLVGYFSERPIISLPKGGVKEVVDYGRKNGARFLLIDTVSVLSRRQELMELLNPLNGMMVNTEFGIEILSRKYYPDLGGYVIYRYIQQRN